MHVPPPPAPPQFTRRLEVETPENVTLDLELAGLGSRALAALIDLAILGAWALAVVVASSALALFGNAGPMAAAITVLVLSLSFGAYFVLFEGLRNGQTPGKRLLGIRVVRQTGHPITMGAAVVRNVLRLADVLPPPVYLVGGALVALHPKGQRLGDMAAGTVVIRDRPQEATKAVFTAPEGAEQLALEAPELEEAEYHLLRRFHERLPSLDNRVRQRVAQQLTARLAGRYPIRDPDDFTFLAELYRQETSRREHGPGVRGGSRGTMAERFVARQQPRWSEFHALASTVAKRGLNSLAAEQLPAFAARYREIAADLARARTYRADQATIQRLERLVSAGHNALYRDEHHTTRRLWQVLMRESPAAVVQAWPYVLIAFLAFAIPAVGGYAALRERPALAEEVLPDQMLRRADAGAARVEEGRKYFRAEGSSRPYVATYIISNNVRVAAACFAGGIFLGVGSLVLLAFNGVAMGTIGGHFANMGLFGYLMEFIVGHGVLELFAIWVAGAAGLLLGWSILVPGRLTRSEALVRSGRRAVRMIAATTLLLLLAGLIEGFLSAGDHDFGYRAAVSGASVVLLLLYLLNGVGYLRAERSRGAGTG